MWPVKEMFVIGTDKRKLFRKPSEKFLWPLVYRLAMFSYVRDERGLVDALSAFLSSSQLTNFNVFVFLLLDWYFFASFAKHLHPFHRKMFCRKPVLLLIKIEAAMLVINYTIYDVKKFCSFSCTIIIQSPRISFRRIGCRVVHFIIASVVSFFVLKLQKQ